jgi:pilus assembly protein TadC
MAKTKTTVKSKKSSGSVKWALPFEKMNYILFGAGILTIIIGYFLLSLGNSTSWDNPISVSVAPVVLVIGYCVLIPYALLYRSKKEEPTAVTE